MSEFICTKCGKQFDDSRQGHLHTSTCRGLPTEESWDCVDCGGNFPRALTGWRCPKCGKRWLCISCSREHEKICLKITPLSETGFTCKLCGDYHADLSDFTKHAETCARLFPGARNIVPAGPHLACVGCGVLFEDGEHAILDGSSHYHPQCVPDAAPKLNDGSTCPICHTKHGHGDMKFSDGAYQYCVKCWSTKYPEADPPKPRVGGNIGALDIQSWFQLRVPTEQEAKDMDTLRATYTNLALDLEILCPAGADRMAALRLLKQSMHTAIGSILTMDAWQTPKGD